MTTSACNLTLMHSADILPHWTLEPQCKQLSVATNCSPVRNPSPDPIFIGDAPLTQVSIATSTRVYLLLQTSCGPPMSWMTVTRPGRWLVFFIDNSTSILSQTQWYVSTHPISDLTSRMQWQLGILSLKKRHWANWERTKVRTKNLYQIVGC